MNGLSQAVGSAVESLRTALVGLPLLGDFAYAPYIFRPFLILLALGIVAGIVGTLVNLRALEFTVEAKVHAVFPGVVGGALWWGLDGIIAGASLVAIVVVLALTAVTSTRRTRDSTEAGTAVVLTAFFGAGIVLSLKVGDRSGQLEALMFGRLLEVSDARLTQSLFVLVVALVVVAATWRGQIFRAFDARGAAAVGVHRWAMDASLNIAIAAVVIAGATAVGVLLVVGFLIVPGAAARLVATRVTGMVAVGIAVAVIGGAVGMWLLGLPWPHRFSPQAAVALSITAGYGVCWIVSLGQRFLPTRSMARECGTVREEQR